MSEQQQFVVECPCGVEIREVSTRALVTAVQEHASAVHQMELDEEQVLDMSRPA